MHHTGNKKAVSEEMDRALRYVADNINVYSPFSYFLKTFSIRYEPKIVIALNGMNIYIGDLFMNYSFEEKVSIVIHELWYTIVRVSSALSI
jgi:predicted metallopeptidase